MLRFERGLQSERILKRPEGSEKEKEWLKLVVGQGEGKKKCTFSDSQTAFCIPLKSQANPGSSASRISLNCLQAVARLGVTHCGLSRNNCLKIALWLKATRAGVGEKQMRK